MNKQISVAVQQHFLSHYRQRIFSLMSSQAEPFPRYTFYSDTSSPEGIVTIDKDSLMPELLNGKGIRWQQVRNWWLGKTILFQPKVLTLAVSSEHDCIIYLGSMYHVTTWISAILAKLSGKRVLMWTHGYLKEEPGFKGYIRETFYRIADGLLLYGHRGRMIMEKRGFDPKTLYVVYNSLDYDLQKSIRLRCSMNMLNALRMTYFKNHSLPILVFTGRITKRKGLELIFQAQHELRLMGMLTNTLVIGDGPDRDRLEKLVEDLNLSCNVNFIGACYDENIIGPLLMMSDICVSPGEVGLTCIHSMAYGVPVITHDDPNTQGPEWEAIIKGVTGSVFKKGDFKSLAKTIFEWLQIRPSENIVSENCIRVVENCYSPKNQLNIINRAVEGLIAENQLVNEA